VRFAIGLPGVLAALMVVCATRTNAQSVRGHVVEDGSRSPITGVVVAAERDDGILVDTTRTDTLGAFLLDLPRGGRYQLRLVHPSYTSPGPIVVNVLDNEHVAVELRMNRSTVPLEPLVVLAPPDQRLEGFYARMRNELAGAQFVTRIQIESRPAARTTDLLREVHGVEILTVGGGIARPRVNMIALRGRCLPTMYLDGIPFEQFPESGVDDFLRPDMLEGVEIYTGAATAPAPIEARGGCGVVAFWTRPVRDTEAWTLRRLLTGFGALASFGLIVLLTR